jgi:hypothetical protein
MNMEKIQSGHFRNWKEVQWKMESEHVCWLLLGSYKGATDWWSECFMTNLFVISIPYRGIICYLTLCIVIKNQLITFLLKKYFLDIIPPPLKLVGDRAIWLSYSDSAMSKLQETPWILTGSEKNFFCWLVFSASDVWCHVFWQVCTFSVEPDDRASRIPLKYWHMSGYVIPHPRWQ